MRQPKDKVVFDLYSGTGTISQIIAPVAKKVVGVEIVEEAVGAAKENAEAIVAKLREGKYSSEAAIIGEVTEEMPGRVVVTTEIGAETLLPPPGGELLPRIC